jgi:Tat protein translocase TatB subunit
MLNIGPPELLLIFVIALVIVGPQRLPELGRTIGKGLREFRKMQDEVKDLVNTGMGDDLKQTTAELRRTATDLKSATDVRSAFRNDAPRTRPHGPGGVTRSAAPGVTPEPDTDVAEPGPDTDAPAPAAPPATPPAGSDEPGSDAPGTDA